MADFRDPSLAVLGVKNAETPGAEIISLLESGGVTPVVVNWETPEPSFASQGRGEIAGANRGSI